MVTNDLACFLSREFRKTRNDIVVVHPIKGLDARSYPHPSFEVRRIDNDPRESICGLSIAHGVSLESLGYV